ncbi:unnamed protein product, partial [Ixodes hexagonus]
MTSSEPVVAQQAPQQQQAQPQHQQQQQQQQSTQQCSSSPSSGQSRGFRSRMTVTRSISLLNYTSSGQRIDYRRNRPISQLAFDLEDGPGGGPGGRALLEASSPSSSGLVLSNFPPQRRESFLYRSDSEFEMSPKSVSRHSSIGSEAPGGVPSAQPPVAAGSMLQ